MALYPVPHLQTATLGLRDILRDATPVQHSIDVSLLRAHRAVRVHLLAPKLVHGVTLWAWLPVDVLQRVQRVLVDGPEKNTGRLDGTRQQ